MRLNNINEKFLDNRILTIENNIENGMANKLVKDLLYLDSLNSKDITLYVNSSGGCVTSMFAIIDTMQSLRSDVRTICIGKACSAGAVILSSGTKGKRFSLSNSYVMIHEISSSAWGTVSQMETDMKRVQLLTDNMLKVLSKNTNKSVKQIKKDTKQDFYMTAKETKQYGIIDKIIKKRTK